MKEYILNRLGERSTWAGITMIATAFGMPITPEQQAAIQIVGVMLAGLPGNIIKR